MAEFFCDLFGLHRPTSENVLRSSAVDQANLRVQIQKLSDQQQRDATRYRASTDPLERRRLKANVMALAGQIARLQQRLRDSVSNSELVGDMQASISDARAMRDGQTVLASQAREFTNVAASIDVRAARNNVRNIQRSQHKITAARQTMTDLAALHRESVDCSNEDAAIEHEDDDERFPDLADILDEPAARVPQNQTREQQQLASSSTAAASALESRFRELGLHSVAAPVATARRSTGNVTNFPSGATNSRVPP